MCIAGIYQKEPAMLCEWWLGAQTRGTTALLVSPQLCLVSGWWLKLMTSDRQTPKQLHRPTYFGLKATWVKNGLTSMGWILSCMDGEIMELKNHSTTCNSGRCQTCTRSCPFTLSDAYFVRLSLYKSICRFKKVSHHALYSLVVKKHSVV